MGTSKVLDTWLHSWYCSAMDKGAPEALVGVRVTGRPSSSSSESLKGRREGVHQTGCVCVWVLEILCVDLSLYLYGFWNVYRWELSIKCVQSTIYIHHRTPWSGFTKANIHISTFSKPPNPTLSKKSSDRCHGGFLPNEVLPLHLLRGFLIFRLPFSLHEGLRWGGQGAGFGFEKPQGGGNRNRRADGGDVWTSSWLNCQWIWLKIFNSWAMNREFRNSPHLWDLLNSSRSRGHGELSTSQKDDFVWKKTGRRHFLHPRKTSLCTMIKQSAWHCFTWANQQKHTVLVIQFVTFSYPHLEVGQFAFKKQSLTL